jgi:hypothetical protein
MIEEMKIGLQYISANSKRLDCLWLLYTDKLYNIIILNIVVKWLGLLFRIMDILY